MNVVISIQPLFNTNFNQSMLFYFVGAQTSAVRMVG